MSRPRSTKQLHPYREPAAMRRAATLMLVRDAINEAGQSELQVLMTRRSLTASFAPGAYVFPGGVCDPQDSQVLGGRLLPTQHHDSPETEALAVAAIREAFEELGVLLAHDIEDAQRAILDRSAPLFDQLAAIGGSLGTSHLVSFSHWRTDRDLHRRFDVRFFVAHMPEGQTPIADEQEQFEPVWVSPGRALEAHSKGQFNIIFPTIRTLRTMARFTNAQALLHFSRAQSSLPTFCPRAGWLNEAEARYTEDEPPFGELALVAPDGQICHDLTWQYAKPVKLLRNVMRLTAPNSSMMTGPGTNTYIVGEPGCYAVIDPGPDIESHISAIATLVGNDCRWIICTHSHPDHHPGAARLKQLTGATIAGRPMGNPAPKHWHFAPELVLETGQRIELGESTLRAIHTPGHASNHVCLVLEDDGLLFSGDHVLNGVTPVISPPDGDMHDYLRTLHLLLKEPIEFILPAHGYVLGDAKGAIGKLIAHRLKREAKVLAAFETLKDGQPSRLVQFAYDDVDSRLHRLAQDSLLAHLIKLVKDGKVPASALPDR
jgi:recombination protein RecT